MNLLNKRPVMIMLWLLSVTMFIPCGAAFASIQCYGCHGTQTSENTGDYRPVDATHRNITTGGFQGNHRNHMGPDADQATCAKCHPGSDTYTPSHRDGYIKLSSRINNSPEITQYPTVSPNNFNHITSAWHQTSSPDLSNATCSKVNCHFETNTPPWGSQPFANVVSNCAKCHNVPPRDGQHPIKADENASKHGIYYGTDLDSCTYCHSDHTKDKFGNLSTPFAHATYAGKRNPNIQLTRFPNSGGSYSGYTSANRRQDYNAFLPSQAALNSRRNGSCSGDGLYCHSDGFRKIPPFNPPVVTPRWGQTLQCNGCHGHATTTCNTVKCHDGATKTYIFNGLVNMSTVLPDQSLNEEDKWTLAMPMYANLGPDSAKPNSHPRHLKKNCNECHKLTASENRESLPAKHVNNLKEVVFKQGGDYDSLTKSCSNITCHTNQTRRWGSAVNSQESTMICYNCHLDTVNGGQDLDIFSNLTAAKISAAQWLNTGHGRQSGKYPYSNNSAARFPDPTTDPPGNPCWYCHDKQVAHKDARNPYRLNMHKQFEKRFEKECVFCHMTGETSECLICHNSAESLAPQLANITSSRTRIAKWANKSSVGFARPDHTGYATTSCLSQTSGGIPCHYVDPDSLKDDRKIHNTGSGKWALEKKEDVKNQYMQMGVCLQCHDDDSGNKCAGCHGVKDAQGNFTNTDGSVHDDRAAFKNISIPKKYKLGYDPGTGTGIRKPRKARASSAHFGNKHYKGFIAGGGWNKNGDGSYMGVWKGGKFCWDCHDPHGDGNIYMIHDKVTTESDGKFGVPRKKPDGSLSQAKVVFTQKTNTGGDYITVDSYGVKTGICYVCHTNTRHYSNNKPSDGHNSSTLCTNCHQHRFNDSHADGQSCNTCHRNKPVPRHSAFGLPVDCVKCHIGTGNLIGRADIMGQFKGQSHHVQGVEVTNLVCYQCHWEATSVGTVNSDYHEGYSFKTFTSLKGRKVDLVIYGPGKRPDATAYRTVSSAAGRATAVQFTASNIGTSSERTEAAKVTNHCLGCHSDQNNETKPFNDCKTPRQYAWDRQSIKARYSQKGVTKWGKYSSATVNAKYKVTKALSAHGNATANQGGWDPKYGTDIVDPDSAEVKINSYRNGTENVQCYDCHNSHGSKAGGVTSSYLSYSGTRGGNLKETQKGIGGYKVQYAPAAGGNPAINPYSAGAGLCFDCHMTSSRVADYANGPPWGYNSTFGATQPIKGYRDGYKFGNRNYASDPNGAELYKLGNGVFGTGGFKKEKAIQGGHLHRTKATELNTQDSINGLCTPCHDPHGVSPTLGSNQAYGVPLLKGTWLSSPYREDFPPPDPTTSNSNHPSHPDSITGANKAWGKGTGRSGNSDGQYNNSPNDNTGKKAPPVTYNIDRNTFGTTSSTTDSGRGGSVRRIGETDKQFAGLCMMCHSKTALIGNGSPNQGRWSSVARIHASNKGWGTNKEHSFTCSKCHQPHNSALPRLMQTNCLDYNHRGGRASGGKEWSSRMSVKEDGGQRRHQVWNDQLRGYPIASIYGKVTKGVNDFYYGKTYPVPAADVSCHMSRPGLVTDPRYSMWPTWTYDNGSSNDNFSSYSSPRQWPGSNRWNRVTPW